MTQCKGISNVNGSKASDTYLDVVGVSSSSSAFHYRRVISWILLWCPCNPFVEPPVVFKIVLHSLHLANRPSFFAQNMLPNSGVFKRDKLGHSYKAFNTNNWCADFWLGPSSAAVRNLTQAYTVNRSDINELYSLPPPHIRELQSADSAQSTVPSLKRRSIDKRK